MGTFSPLTTHYYLYFVQFIARTKTILPPILLTVSCVFVCGAVPMWVVLSSASVLGLFEYKILGWDLAIARYQPRPCGQQRGFAHTFFLELILIFISAIYPSYQWFLKWSVTENELTDRTHTRIVSFIVLDNMKWKCTQQFY